MASPICDAFGGLSALALPAHSHQCLRRLPSRRDSKDRGRDHSHGLIEAKSRAEPISSVVQPALRGARGGRDLVPGNHHPAHDGQGGERFLRIGSLHRQYYRLSMPFTTRLPWCAPHAGIQHINHQVETNVLRSYYFLNQRRVPIVFGPGRHPTSGARFL
jgi:hypothetical protein